MKIMPTINPYHTVDLGRRDEVVIHRLRIGHTRLTTAYKMEGRKDPDPCNFCGDGSPLTVRHLLLECTNFLYERRDHYEAADLEDLFTRYPPKSVIDFLKEVNLYDRI